MVHFVLVFSAVALSPPSNDEARQRLRSMGRDRHVILVARSAGAPFSNSENSDPSGHIHCAIHANRCHFDL
jgi:hypothetical protein